MITNDRFWSETLDRTSFKKKFLCNDNFMMNINIHVVDNITKHMLLREWIADNADIFH